jgi:MarR family transcriptional regulator, 2-MHQ and catechol-resistance regulon repressor
MGQREKKAAEKAIEGLSSTDRDFGLWRLLDHTRFMISRLREKELDQFGITPETAHILDILSHNSGSRTMNELVEITVRRHHSISTQIIRMVKMGLVKKIKSKNDLREYKVVITEKGDALFRRITRDSIAAAFSCLSEEDKKDLDTRLKSLLLQAYDLNGREYKWHLPTG